MKKYKLKNVLVISGVVLVIAVLLFLIFPNFFALFAYSTMNCAIESPTYLRCTSVQGGMPLATQTQITDVNGGLLREGSSIVNKKLMEIPAFAKLMSWDKAGINECYMSSRFDYRIARETLNYEDSVVNIFTHGGFCGGQQMPLVSAYQLKDFSSLFKGDLCKLQGSFNNPLVNQQQTLLIYGWTDVEDGFLKCIFNFTNDQIARESPYVTSFSITVDLAKKYENSEKYCIINNTDCRDPNVLLPLKCIESWKCGEWSSCISQNQKRECFDSNNCGTFQDKPNIWQDCCIEDWECSDYGICSNNIQKRICADNSNCGTLLNKPATSQPCVDQIPPISPEPPPIAPLEPPQEPEKKSSSLWIIISISSIILAIIGLIIYIKIRR